MDELIVNLAVVKPGGLGFVINLLQLGDPDKFFAGFDRNAGPMWSFNEEAAVVWHTRDHAETQAMLLRRFV